MPVSQSQLITARRCVFIYGAFEDGLDKCVVICQNCGGWRASLQEVRGTRLTHCVCCQHSESE